MASSKHFSADDDQPLDNVVRAVLMERALSLETIQQNSGLSSADVALGLASRIKSVASAGGTRADLTKFLQEQKVPLKMLDSDSTPILKHGINVFLFPPRTEPSTNKEPTASINDRLLNRDEGEVRYLPKPPDKDSPRFDEQLRDALTVLFGPEGLGLGYYNPNQMNCLTDNIRLLASTLCFIEKHFGKFFHGKQFPSLPKTYADNKLLQCLAECSRGKKSTERLEIKKIANHLEILATKMRWNLYKNSSKLKSVLRKVRDDIDNIYGLLNSKKLAMAGHNQTGLFDARVGVASFREIPGFVILNNDNMEYFVPISPYKQSSGKKPGMYSFARQIDVHVCPSKITSDSREKIACSGCN